MAKRAKPESIFTTDFGKAWEAAGGDWYKIPDVGGPLARFAKPRRYDVQAAMNEKFFTIECKVPKSFQLRLSDFRPHQIPALVRSAKFGYKAYGLACYQHKSYGMKIADFFDVRILENLRLRGVDYVPHELASLRVYKLRGTGWDLHAEQIAAMIEKPLQMPRSFFEVA